MTGNWWSNMRSASRSPPFLVVGLLIAVCILAFNYWSVTSKNTDLKKQLESLSYDFRSASDKSLSVEKRVLDLNSQAVEYMSKIEKLQHSASEKDVKVQWLNEQLGRTRQQLESIGIEKQQAEDEKKSVLEDLAQTRRELDEEKKKGVVCNKSMCREVVREVMTVMLNHVGKSVVNSAFLPHHTDILSMVDDLVRGATDPPPVPEQGKDKQYTQDGAQQQYAGQVPNNLPGQGQVFGQNLNMGQNQQNPNIPPPQHPDQGQVPEAGAQNPELGRQDMTFGKNLGVFGGNADVVQMKQQPQLAETHNQVVVDSRQQQSFGIPGQQNPETPNPVLQANPPLRLQEREPKKEENDKVGEQEIVAQNIPQGNGGDEAAISNNQDDHHHIDDQLHDLNAAPAQEDVGEDDRHADLPEDEMDKQAAANHEQGDMGNLEENFHNQLHELSRNDNKLDKGDTDDMEQDRAMRVGVDDDDQDRVDRKEEDGDNDFVEGPLH